MQTTEKPTDTTSIWFRRMQRLAMVAYPLALAATITGLLIAVPGTGALVLLGIATVGTAVSFTALFVGIALYQKQQAAQKNTPPVQNNEAPQPPQNKEQKMSTPAYVSKTPATVGNIATAVGAFLIGLFALSSGASATSDKSDKKVNQDAVTYVVSPAILNEEEKRRQPSNPKKSGQKKALRSLFNLVPRTIGTVNNKQMGAKYPQTHIKRGACNNLRQS